MIANTISRFSQSLLRGIMGRRKVLLEQLLLISCCCHLEAHGLCSREDVEGLQGFTSGITSGLPLSWNLTNNSSLASSCCEWTGITCSSSSLNTGMRVVGLSLPSLGLQGHVSPSLAKLDHLATLDLHNNSLQGPIPQELFLLPSLETLHLGSNHFNGSIPANSNLKSIRELDLSWNRLSGTLPLSFSNLSAIRQLRLNDNFLEGVIDLEFARMPELRILMLGSNQFTGNIPLQLSPCKNLETLDLSRNRLSGTIPAGFRNLKALSTLFITNNTLSNISSALQTLQHCSNLSNLVLTINFMGEQIPSIGIGGFESLRILVIAYCGLHGGIPRWLGRSSKLQILDLSWNKLSGSIPPWIGDFGSLFYLDLSNNTLSGEIPHNLCNLNGHPLEDSSQAIGPPFFSRRRSTTLQYNKASSFPPSLLLSDNSLTGPIWPQFGNLRWLHVLDIKNNSLTGSIPEELSNMKALESLDLSHNELSGHIPASLGNLSFLSHFNVSYNHLTGAIPSGTQFSTFPKSSYQGNAGLCGGLLPPCSSLLPEDISSGEGEVQEQSLFGLPFQVGLTTGFVATFVTLVTRWVYCAGTPRGKIPTGGFSPQRT